MPEIIGSNPNYKVSCNNCGVKLGFRLDEVKAGGRIPGSDEADHDSVITCPKCYKSIRVTHLIGATSQERAQAQAADELRRDYDL